ncbi:MAG: hypothetical protein Q8L48_39325 [Archangium sp.]|nr:hypothetical protein [Archangium sp.]
MEIVAALSTQLKLEENTAAGLAGALLQLIEDLVLERVDYGAAGRMRKAVPELGEWRGSAPTIAPGMFSLSALPASPGPGDEGEFASVLTRFGADASAGPMVAGLLSQFLATRLDSKLFASVVGAVPMLSRSPG